MNILLIILSIILILIAIVVVSAWLIGMMICLYILSTIGKNNYGDDKI